MADDYFYCRKSNPLAVSAWGIIVLTGLIVALILHFVHHGGAR
jgi:hypothetical protein